MKRTRKASLHGVGFGVMTALAACQGPADAADPSSPGQAEPAPQAVDEGSGDIPPIDDSTEPGPDSRGSPRDGGDTTPVQQSLPLVRRAELRVPESTSASAEMKALLPVVCGDAHSVTGQLDADSFFVDQSAFGFLVDAYVVTALESGTVSIASSVEPLGDAYVYGYGYPLNAQRVDPAAALPTLSGSLIPGTSLPDNALDDGKARMDLAVEAGTQYVISFKGLVGPASTGTGWRYTLGLCGDKLRVDGKLWVSNDQDDRVPMQPLSGLIARDNAAPGAMGALAQTIQVR